MSGTFIVVDGIDGSGKSSMIHTWTEFLTQQGKNIFYLKEYWKTHSGHPTAEELSSYDVIVSAEPTYVWTGAALRQEMIQENSTYSARAMAEGYALDRLVLYKRLIVPLLEQGKIIIQDRSVSTSLCYQSIQDNPLTLEEVAALEGNTFALEHAPDYLVIVDVPASIAIDRIRGREDKRDNAVFEKQSFLEKARQTFLNDDFQSYFSSRGTEIHVLNSALPLDIMKSHATTLLQSFNI